MRSEEHTMFAQDTNADETVSRRSVLKTTAGLIAGSTALVGLGAGRGAAETEEDLQAEVREMNEEYIAVEVVVPDHAPFDGEMPILLGHAERFVLHEDGEWVSLPEDTEGLANSVELEKRDVPGGAGTFIEAYFRTADVDLSAAEGEEVVLGVGFFPERTVPEHYWATCPGHRDY
jgi:hypothetical protein